MLDRLRTTPVPQLSAELGCSDANIRNVAKRRGIATVRAVGSPRQVCVCTGASAPATTATASPTTATAQAEHRAVASQAVEPSPATASTTTATASPTNPGEIGVVLHPQAVALLDRIVGCGLLGRNRSDAIARIVHDRLRALLPTGTHLHAWERAAGP